MLQRSTIRYSHPRRTARFRMIGFVPSICVLPPQQRYHLNVGQRKQHLWISPIPIPSPANRKRSQSNRRAVITSQWGFGILSGGPPDAINSSLLPSPDAPCACASSKTYGKCCRRFHTAQMVAQQAEDLLRSRYSAYAYRLPSYIMKTTHSSAIELDRRMWRREIMNFCKDYQFVGGVDIVEMQMPAPFTTRILFRANLMQTNAPISFMELATFVCESNIWYYKSGKLVDIDESG